MNRKTRLDNRSTKSVRQRVALSFLIFVLLILPTLGQNSDVILQQEYRPYMFSQEISGEIQTLIPSSTVRKQNVEDSVNEIDEYTIVMQKINQQILPSKFPKTPIFAYGGLTKKGLQFSFPGPTLIAKYKIPTKIKWENNLFGSHILAYDMNHPFNSSSVFVNEIPVVPHVHGIANHNSSDGQPMAYWTALGSRGARYFSEQECDNNQAVYTYPNQQEPGLFWYHDHTMGMTRLNVYAGLAGMYLIEDQQKQRSAAQQSIRQYYGNNISVKTLVITDKTFHRNGSLYYSNQTTNKHFSSWVPEFFGNTFVINGKVWPKMVLAPQKYRFIILNACQARYINFFFFVQATQKIIPFDLIRTQGDYLNNPVRISQYLTSLSARIQIIVDFTAFKSGTNILLKNNAPAPFPDGDSDNLVDQFTGTIIKIQIKGVTPAEQNTKPYKYSQLQLLNDVTWWNNRQKFVQRVLKQENLQKQGKSNVILSEFNQAESFIDRKIVEEVIKDCQLKNAKYPAFPQGKQIYTTIIEVLDDQGLQSSGMYIDGISFETSLQCKNSVYKTGQTYDFYMINLTPDAHPIHFHLINFQKIMEIPFDPQQYKKAWFAKNGECGRGGYSDAPEMLDPSPYFTGPPKMPQEFEKSFRDIIDLQPEYVTVLRMKFAHNNGQPFSFSTKKTSYVYHCHMLQHEDNDMMKTFCLQ